MQFPAQRVESLLEIGGIGRKFLRQSEEREIIRVTSERLNFAACRTKVTIGGGLAAAPANRRYRGCGCTRHVFHQRVVPPALRRAAEKKWLGGGEPPASPPPPPIPPIAPPGFK